jgi:hypothetical protein
MTEKIKYNFFYVLQNFVFAVFAILIFIKVFYETVFVSNYIGYVLMVILWFIAYLFTANSLRNTYRYLSNLPAIEFTEFSLIDHQQNVIHHWNNIQKIEIVTRKSTTFAVFKLKNKKEYIEQLNNPEKFLLKNFPDVIPIQVNLTYIKGNNKNIIHSINSHFTKYRSYP